VKNKTPLTKKESKFGGRALGEHRRKALTYYGFDPQDLTVWRHKWFRLVQRSRAEDKECTLTFIDYISLAKAAGLTSPDQIGRSQGQYQMGRLGDTGGYILGNCRFITMQQNQDERKQNGGTAIAVEKAAKIRRGQTKENNKSIRSMAKKLNGRTADEYDYLRVAGLRRGKRFRVVSPTGIVYKGDSLNAFCKEHNLSQASMSLVCRGKKNQYFGWTGKYLKKKPI
jgi:hypothetical protein